MDNVTRLLAVLQDYAPNGEAQEVCAQMVRRAQSQGASVLEVEKTLVGALADGLNSGNWPWA